MSRRSTCRFRILNRLYIGPARGKVHLILIQPDQSVAANALHRLHLDSNASVGEFSTTRSIHARLLRYLLRVYSMLALVVAVNARRFMEGWVQLFP